MKLSLIIPDVFYKLLKSITIFLILCVPLEATATGFETRNTIKADLNALLENQRVIQEDCHQTVNTLQKIFCRGTIKVGIRNTYKGFGLLVEGEPVGFEIDLARKIAELLNVSIEFIPVTPGNRIGKLLDGDIDFLLATTAHTRRRAEIVHFVRPHYYASPTSVVGLKSKNINNLEELEMVSICVPLGSYANVTFAQAGARLLIFDKPHRMVDAARFGACDLVAHDRSLIIGEFTGPQAPSEFQDTYEEKFWFHEIPWGLAVRHDDSDTLGRALSLIIAGAHADGTLVDLAKLHGVYTNFLELQKTQWSNGSCVETDGTLAEQCLLSPPNIGDRPSSIAPIILSVQSWIKSNIGTDLSFAMLSGKEGLRLFLSGIFVSVILVVSATFATIIIALLFYRLMRSNLILARWLGFAVCTISLNAPSILLLIFTYLIISTVFIYSPAVAVLTAVLAIGLNNGAPAGSALISAANTLGPHSSLREALSVSIIQIRACVINAAKTSPVAAFIGAPEMLAVLTEITSFSGERIVSFTVLALFYILMVQLVVKISDLISARLQVT